MMVKGQSKWESQRELLNEQHFVCPLDHRALNLTGVKPTLGLALYEVNTLVLLPSCIPTDA